MKSDYTVRELAVLLGVHPETLRRLARAGRLSGAYKVGARWRFAREAIGDLRSQVARSIYSTGIELGALDGEVVT